MNQEPKSPGNRVVEDLRDKILNGALQPGLKLPSYEQLGTEYNVDKNTAARAIGVLRSERLVYTHQGKGTFVMNIEDRRNGNESSDELTNSIVQQMQRLHDRLEGIEGRLADLEKAQGQ